VAASASGMGVVMGRHLASWIEART
jgi:hypothetical protein